MSIRDENLEVLGALFTPEEGDLDFATTVEISGFADAAFVGGIFDGVAKFAKSIVKSPITKAVAGGVALAFPPAAPVAAGIVVADRAIRVAEGARGTPKQQVTLKAAITRTALAARKGDPGAKRAVEFMAAARRIRAMSAKAAADAAAAARARASKSRKLPVMKGRAQGGILVQRGGRIKRGNFVET